MPAPPYAEAYLPRVPKLVQRFDLWRMNRRKGSFVAPTEPHFGAATTTAFFRDCLGKASVLIEFGAGGSTFLAAKLGLPFVSVESDPGFLTMMKDRIAAEGLLDLQRQTYLHRDIGPTRRWGQPLILQAPDAARLALFDAMSDFPAEALQKPMERPVVLVDGRFRVACALKAIRALAGRDFLLLVDDYRSRKSYYRIAEFARQAPMQGRMAVFQPKTDLDLPALDRAIRQTVLDWR